jgi:hypothetical protein
MSSNFVLNHTRLNKRVNTQRMDAPFSNKTTSVQTASPAGRKSEERAVAAAVSAAKAAPRVRIKTVALPTEHGGWGLSLEPVVLGMLVAPSLAGLCLALATVGAFLARHPLKIAVADWRRGRRFPRTRVAEAFAALYGTVALSGFVAAALTGPAALLIPLALALPLAIIQLAYDFKSRSRALLPELAGATAMAALVASLALAGGFALLPALALWAILTARVLPTILYVRARLRAGRGERVAGGAVIFVHLLACAAALALLFKGLASMLALAALAILLIRAVVGLNSPPVSAKRVGITELLYGALLVGAVVTGHVLGI